MPLIGRKVIYNDVEYTIEKEYTDGIFFIGNENSFVDLVNIDQLKFLKKSISWEEYKEINLKELKPEYYINHLLAYGYRRVSNKYKIVARVNIPHEKIRSKYFKHIKKFKDYMKDSYRRCHSVDAIEGIPKQIYDRIPNSNHN